MLNAILGRMESEEKRCHFGRIVMAKGCLKVGEIN